MVKKTKINSSIYFYKDYTLLNKFNTFVDRETSVTVEAEDRDYAPPKSPEQLLLLAVVYQA